MKTFLVLIFGGIMILGSGIGWASEPTMPESSESEPKVQLVPIGDNEYAEVTTTGKKCGAECSQNGGVCPSCAISCPEGKAAVCTPGKVFCGGTKCQCQRPPSCRCR